MPAFSGTDTTTLLSADSLQVWSPAHDSLWWTYSLGVAPVEALVFETLCERPLMVWDTLAWGVFPVHTPKDSLSVSVSVTQYPVPDLPHQDRVVFPSDLFLLAIIASVSLLAFIRAAFYKIFGQLFTAVFDFRASARIFSSRTELYRNMSLFVQILFPLNISLLAHELVWWYAVPVWEFPEILSLLLVGVVVAVIYGLKYLLCKFMGMLLMRPAFFDEYLHSVFVFNKAYAVILTVPVVCIPFAPVPVGWLFVWAALGSAFLLLVWWLVRVFQIILTHRFPVFYFLLYLCTLEIIPVLMAVKALRAVL